MFKKRIAVITARADDTEQRAILSGITGAAFANNCDVAVFANIHNHWIIDEFLNFENVIYDLFDPTMFDGVIVTAEAFRELSMIEKVLERIRISGIPAAAVGRKIEGFMSVLSDDAGDMGKITEHLIREHGFRKIDILTGQKGDPIAEQRLSGCISTFERCGIPSSEVREHYGNFWIDSGEELAKKYLSKELTMPQAVICANDYMAYGLCDALTAGGVDIPGKISVTGYDCTDSRIYHYPFLTTYRRNRKKMGADAVKLLLSVPYALPDEDGGMIPGNTCPCGIRNDQLSEEIRSVRIDKDYAQISSVAQFTDRLTLCRTLSGYTGVIKDFFYLLHGASELYLCLDKAWNSSSFDGEEFLCCKIYNSAFSPPIMLSSEKLIPSLFDMYESPVLFYFNPLHFQTRLFGYTALRYTDPQSFDSSLRDWSKIASNALEFLRMKNDIQYLKQCQRDSALYDSLTGFYNLREFREIMSATGTEGHSVHAVKLCFFESREFFHGENYRSDIISTVAKAVKRAGINHEILCRASDDLFIVMSKSDNSYFSDRMRAIICHDLCTKYDETTVAAVYADESGADETALSALFSKITKSAARHYEAINIRSGIMHYKALAEIRRGIYCSPKSAGDTDSMSKKLCISSGYFRAIYQKCFGVSFNQDCIDARIMLGKYLLCTTAMSIYSIAVSCGYSDEKYFSRQFRQHTGCSPMKYREESY